MAIFYFNFSNGKVGKGAKHYDYINGKEEYNYKNKEVSTIIDRIPSFADTPREFWKAADEFERINGRVYKEIRLALPYELSIEENEKLLKEFLEKELKNYYYSAVIHDKESSIAGINNVHAHLMICPRKIDGIERTKEQFFKRYNPKNPERGGALKDTYWNKKDTLIHFRESWEETLNNTLEKKQIDKVSSKSLETLKQLAIENRDEEKANFYDREGININGYILKKDKKYFNECEEVDFEVFQINKEIRDLKNELYKLEMEKLEKEKVISEIKNLNKEIAPFVMESKKVEKEFANIYDIEENILLLEVEKKYEILNMDLKTDEEKEKSKLRILSLEFEISKFNSALNLELSSLSSPEEFDKKYKKLNEETLRHDLTKNIKVEKNIMKLEKQINFYNDKISKLDLITFNVLTKGEYGKLYNQYRKVPNEELENKLKKIEKIYSTKKEKSKFIKTKYQLEKKYTNLLNKAKEDLEKEKVKKGILISKIEMQEERKTSIFYNLLKNIERTIENNNLKIEKLKIQLQKLEKLNIKKLTYNKLTSGRYGKLLEEYNNELTKQKNINYELSNSSFLNFGKKFRLKSELEESQNKVEDIKNEYADMKRNISISEFNNLENKISNKVNNNIKVIKNQIEGLKENNAINRKIISNAHNGVGRNLGINKNLHDSFTKSHNNMLGQINNSGNGIKLAKEEDSWEKQIRRELDFSL